MKLATFIVKTVIGPVERLGAVVKSSEQDQLVDLTSGYAAYLADAGEETKIYEHASLRTPPNMMNFLGGSDLSMKAARDTLKFVTKLLRETESPTGPKGEKLVFDLGDHNVRLLAPVPHPPMILDYSLYEDHISTRGMTKPKNWYIWPSMPYKGEVSSIIGPGEPFERPYYCKTLDMELELAIIIGRKGYNIPVEEAHKYIAGYSIFVDGSARDHRGKDSSLFKHKDFCNALGPYLVTPDDFNERDAKAIIRVDDEVWFEGNTGENRVFFSSEMVAYYSDTNTILPGAVLGTGAIGHGCSIDIGKWFEPGMVVEMEIEGIGILRNPVVQGEQAVDYALNGMGKYAHLKYEDQPEPGRTRYPPVKG